MSMMEINGKLVKTLVSSNLGFEYASSVRVNLYFYLLVVSIYTCMALIIKTICLR